MLPGGGIGRRVDSGSSVRGCASSNLASHQRLTANCRTFFSENLKGLSKDPNANYTYDFILSKTTLSVFFPLFALSQDDGEESAAEASVTGSAAQPSFGSSGSIEGNPLVQAVRSGLVSLDDAMNLGLGKIRDLSSLGGNFGDLLTSYASAGDVDLVMVQKLNALGLNGELLKAALQVAADYDSSSLQNQEALVSAAT